MGFIFLIICALLYCVAPAWLQFIILLMWGVWFARIARVARIVNKA